MSHRDHIDKYRSVVKPNTNNIPIGEDPLISFFKGESADEEKPNPNYNDKIFDPVHIHGMMRHSR